jgi:hypothetical protein
MDRTGLKILENNKNIQPIISVNTNILLRRFRLEFLRIMCSTSCYKERVNFENTLYCIKLYLTWVYINMYRVIINECPIAVGVGDVVECVASLITWVRLVSLIGGAPGGSGNLSTTLSDVARLPAHPKFVWVFNANCDGTIIYNDPVCLLKDKLYLNKK